MSALTAGMILNSLPQGALALEACGSPFYVNAAALGALGLPATAGAVEAWQRLCVICPDADAALAATLRGSQSRVIHAAPGGGFEVHFQTLGPTGGPAAGALATFRTCAAALDPPGFCAADAERTRNELLESILERLPVMISVRNSECRPTYANRAWRDCLGGISQDPFVSSEEARSHLLSATGEWRECSVVLAAGNSLDLSCASVPLPDSAVLAIAQDVTARKAAERMIQASEARLRAVLQNSAERVLLIDPSGFVLQDWTGANLPLLGYPAGELAGMWAFEVIHPDDRDRARAILASIVADPGRVGAGEFCCRAKDGSWRHLEVTASNLTHIAAVSGVVVNARDVTDARSAERILRESEDRFRSLFAASPLGIAVVATGGEYLEVNPAFCQMLGYDESELLSMTVTDVLHPDDVCIEEASFGPTAESDQSGLRFERRYIRKDGGTVWATVAASVVKDQGGRALYSIRVVEDVTQRTIAQQALKASEHRYRELFEHATDFVYTTDLAGRLTSVNRAGERLTGYTRPELLERTLADLVELAHDGVSPEFVPAGTQAHHAAPIEVNIRTSDGRLVPVELSASVLIESGRPSAVLGIGRNIAERKNAERELRASHDRLRELTAYLETAREQERTRISREIHDELGQMLTVLNMDLDGLAVACNALCPAAAELTKRIAAARLHVRASIESVKKISAELRPGVLDHLGLGAAITWQAREFEKRFGIRCTVESPGDSLILPPDRSTAVFRIFQEALTNIARHAHAQSAAVSVSMSHGWLRLRVTDDGAGIDESAIRDPKSLGLLGMRERALLLGGSLSVRGVPGAGTTLTLRIPSERRPARRPPARISAAGPGVPVPRILIADDHTVFRKGLRHLLEERFDGAEFGEATDGEETLDLLHEGEWNLLLLDIAMPGKSGLDVLGAMKPAGINVPVLVLSSHSEDECRAIAARYGVRDYISKGQPSSALVDAVRRVLAAGPPVGEPK